MSLNIVCRIIIIVECNSTRHWLLRFAIMAVSESDIVVFPFQAL